ncbi:hypothetical protein AVEN_142469-1 [Araneus ventricosus]|uniref:Uncharacterized protein n=1 Tax=Araneus ventricosus TaxID=182803 RepID=A0A4Y2DT46_ARAVE|nr:hypothetical protein AVEN_142469-1 [Araneus ventricosus]
MIENGKKVMKNVKGRRKSNQELRERLTRAAESFSPPSIEISRIELLGALSRKKKATLSPIEIRTPRAAPGAALDGATSSFYFFSRSLSSPK